MGCRDASPRVARYRWSDARAAVKARRQAGDRAGNAVSDLRTIEEATLSKGLLAGAFWGVLVSAGMLTTAALVVPPPDPVPQPATTDGPAASPDASSPATDPQATAEPGAQPTLAPEPEQGTPAGSDSATMPADAGAARPDLPAADAARAAGDDPQGIPSAQTDARQSGDDDVAEAPGPLPPAVTAEASADPQQAGDGDAADVFAPLPLEVTADASADPQQAGDGDAALGDAAEASDPVAETPPEVTAEAQSPDLPEPGLPAAAGPVSAGSAPDGPVLAGPDPAAPTPAIAEADPQAPPVPAAGDQPAAPPAAGPPPAVGGAEGRPEAVADLAPDPAGPDGTLPTAPPAALAERALADAGPAPGAPELGMAMDLRHSAIPDAGTPPAALADGAPDPGRIDPPELRRREAPPPPLPMAPLSPPPAPADDEVLAQTPADGDQAAPAPRIGFDRAVDGVQTGRLPRISAGDADAADQQDAQDVAQPDTQEPDESLPALQRNAEPFDNPDGRPVFVVLLLDDGVAPQDREILAALPFPVTFVVDPSQPDATEVAALYRAAGKEVVMLASAIPAGATAADLEVTFEAHLRAVPTAVALIDMAEGGFQNNRQISQQVVTILSDSGHGLVTFDRGLNAADQVARSAGLGAARVFRALDDDNENASTIRRYLDRAVFRAAQEGQVAVLGRARNEDTMAGLLQWRMEGRAEGVALAPASALLRP